MPEQPPTPATDSPRAPTPAARRTGFLLYFGHLATVFGIALSNLLLGLCLVTLPWTVRLKEVPWRRARAVLVPLGLYVLFLLASILASYDPTASLRGLREILSLTTLPLALVLVRGEKAVRRVVDGLVAVAALLALSGLGQYLLGYGDLDQRIRGPFSHYMTFAGVLLLGDLLLLARMARGDGWKSPWRWLALAVISLAILGSLTRSAWVGLALALTVLLALRAPRLLLAYIPAWLLLLSLAPQPFVARVVSIADPANPSNYDRLCMAEAGLVMIAERPFFGQGPELIKQRYPIYRNPTAPRHWVPHLHNTFLELAAERGLPSLAAYLALMAASLGAAWRGYRREGEMGGRRSDLYLGVILALLAFNLMGLFEANWKDTEVQRLALFLLAVPFCMRETRRASALTSPPERRS